MARRRSHRGYGASRRSSVGPIGTIDIHARGYAFCDTDEGSFFVPRSALGGAMPGDKVEQIEKLMKQQEADQESMDPYTKAKKACDEKMNADGANAALENIIRIQEDRIEDQKELSKLWDQVEKLLK